MSSQFFAWLTAFSFACANVTVGHGMRYSTPLTATFVSLIVHTTVLWTALFFTSGIPAINFIAVGAIFLTGIVQPFMRFFQYKGMEKIGTSRAVTLRNSYPVLSVLIGILFLGERISLLGILGTVLIVSGIVLSSWKLDERFKDFRWLYVVFPLITATITAVVHPLRRYALMQANEPLFLAALVGPLRCWPSPRLLLVAGKHRQIGLGSPRLLAFFIERPRSKPSPCFSCSVPSLGSVYTVSPISATVADLDGDVGAIFLAKSSISPATSVIGTIV